MQSDTVMGYIILGTAVALWIWVLLDCIRDTTLEPASHKRWIAFVALVPGIGAFFYVQHRRSTHKALNYPRSEKDSTPFPHLPHLSLSGHDHEPDAEDFASQEQEEPHRDL